MTFVSYAQNFEDVLLWRAFGDIAHGFYIDVGAAHPDIDSVTRAFFERGWRGINIEPGVADAARLAAARPGDITLQLAAGSTDTEADFFAVPGTGLSTLDQAVAERLPEPQKAGAQAGRTAVRTLAGICRAHVRGDIHFLKIDVEGREADVLAGADFAAWRPWVIVVEATAPLSSTPTHAEWEPGLIEQGYRFAWFDGLNRFYLAEERAEALSRHFRTPPNVFDDFICARDTLWAERIATAETRAALSEQRVAAELDRAAQAARRASTRDEYAEQEIAALRRALSEHQRDAGIREAAVGAELHLGRHELQQAHLRLQAALREGKAARQALDHAETELEQTTNILAGAHHQLHHTTLALDDAQKWLGAVRQSRTWRLTGPVRVAVRTLKRDPAPTPQPPMPGPPVAGTARRRAPLPLAPAGSQAGPQVGPQAGPRPAADVPRSFPGIVPALCVATPPPSRQRRRVHQFHSGSAVGDAITNAMLLTRTVLRGLGYESEIFAAHLAPELAHEIRPIAALPAHDDYVLIVRHSMGFDSYDRIVALPAPKILFYHNITPAALLTRQPALAAYAELGRRQLAALRGHVHAALADSEYNAIELRQLGFDPVRTCAMLFDIDAMRARAASAPRDVTLKDVTLKNSGAVFTILFVGRISQSKAQLDLIAAYNAFRVLYHAPARLVLVGRDGGAADPYAAAVERAIACSAAPGEIIRTGLVNDDERDAWYGRADLYVSLSRHEGFGVPLVEAMAHGVAVAALPSGAVPYTVGEAAAWLPEAAGAGELGAMLDALARDAPRRRTMAQAGCASLDRFRLDGQAAILSQALLRAGAALPVALEARPALAANLHFAVTGHVNGSYSLAAINRSLALSLEVARPGRVRLIPVEGVFTTDFSGAPVEDAKAIAALAWRAAPLSAPELIISQHYPVHVPPRADGQIRLALVFWEESLLPAETIATLQDGFDGVVAPTRFVAKALQDSGLRLPVRVIAHQPALSAFRAARSPRTPGMPRAPGTPHSFLHVSSCFPRKGVDVLLRAWARAFTARDPVRLLIKSFANPHNTVAADLEALRVDYPDMAPVTLIERELDQAGLAGLYAESDVMVLPSRGEGYNLPAAEALAAGLRLIVTGAGGHMDFCRPDDPRIRLLRYRHAPSASHVAVPHALWLEPDLDDLTAALRAAPRTPKMPEAADEALSVPRPIDTAEALGGFGLDLLTRPPAGPVRVAWVSSWGQRCGIAEYSRLLLAALEPDPALEVTVLCDNRTLDFPPLPGTPPHVPCWQQGDRSLAALLAAVERVDADAVVVQHQPGLMDWPLLERLIEALAARRLLLTVTLHSTHGLLDLPRERRRSLLAALSGCDRVMVHTLAHLDLLIALEAELGLGANLENRLTLFPHGIRAPLAPRPARALDASDAPTIGCYGFFLPGKGIDTLIESCVTLRERWPLLRLKLVNAAYGTAESDAEIARGRELAKPLGAAARFETAFLPQDQSLVLLADCDLVVLPHRPSKEGFSGALSTALTASTAVAVSKIALFDDAEPAVLRVDASTADSLARDLDAVLRDPGRRRLVQQQAGEWMRARAWPVLARRMADMLVGMARSSELTR